MKTVWVVIRTNKKRQVDFIYWDTATYKRKKSVMIFMRPPFPEPATWKQKYNDGFRCVQVKYKILNY